MAEQKATKIKKTKWIQIVAPKSFNNEFIGEIPITESKSLAGKSITVNLMTLTRDMKQQNTNIRFTIGNIQGESAVTELYGYYLNGASIKRLARRGKEKIEFSFACKTSDGKRIRVKPIIVTYNKVNRSISAALKKEAIHYLIPQLSKVTLEEAVMGLINTKLNRALKDSLKKIYPPRIAEITILHIESEKEVVEISKDKIKLDEVKEEEEETPVEEKPAEKKEEKPKETKKKEEKVKEAPKEEIEAEEVKEEEIEEPKED